MVQPNVTWDFLSAAIQIKLPDGTEKIFTGKRHHEIIKDIHDAGLTDIYKETHVDGFMLRYTKTRNGKNGKVFKDRTLSTEIAKSMGIWMRSGVLTSEDLW